MKLDLLLEAEPDELAGIGSSEVAQHVAHCSRCRAVANEILEGQGLLAGGIRALGPAGDVGLVVGRIRLRDRRRRQLRKVVLPLAAAAVLSVLVVGDRMSNGNVFDDPAGDVTNLEMARSIQVSPNRNVAVMKTDNPKITVIWFY
jgi:hypothetical protein